MVPNSFPSPPRPKGHVPFEVGDIVASVAIGRAPAFIGRVIAVHQNWVCEYYYHVIDPAGLVWCRELNDIWPASSDALARAA